METKIIKLDEEMKKKLKRSLGFDVYSFFKYVPIDYRDPGNEIPKELWPVFTLSGKDGLQIAELEDSIGDISYSEATKETRMKLNSGKQRIRTLEQGIKKVSNFYLSNGGKIEADFTKEKSKFVVINDNGSTNVIGSATPKDLIKYFSSDLQVELQEAINERKCLTDEELLGLE